MSKTLRKLSPVVNGSSSSNGGNGGVITIQLKDREMVSTPLMVKAYEMQRVQLDEAGFRDMVDNLSKLPEFSNSSFDHKKLYDQYISISTICEYNLVDSGNEIQRSILFIVNSLLLFLFSHDAQLEIIDDLIANSETNGSILNGGGWKELREKIKNALTRGKKEGQVLVLAKQASGWEFSQVVPFVAKCAAGMAPMLLARGIGIDGAYIDAGMVAIVILNTLVFDRMQRLVNGDIKYKQTQCGLATLLAADMLMLPLTSATIPRALAFSIASIASSKMGIQQIDRMLPNVSVRLPRFAQKMIAKGQSKKRELKTITFRETGTRADANPNKYKEMYEEEVSTAKPDEIAKDPRFKLEELIEDTNRANPIFRLKPGKTELINSLAPSELTRLKNLLNAANMQMMPRYNAALFSSWVQSLKTTTTERFIKQQRMREIECNGEVCKELGGCTFSYDAELNCIRRNFPANVNMDHDLFYGRQDIDNKNNANAIRIARDNAIARGIVTTERQAILLYPDIPNIADSMSDADQELFRSELLEQCKVNIFPCPQMMQHVDELRKAARGNADIEEINRDYGFGDTEVDYDGEGPKPGQKLLCSRCCLKAFDLSLDVCKKTSPLSPLKWPVYLDTADIVAATERELSEVLEQNEGKELSAPAVRAEIAARLATNTNRILLSREDLDALITKLTHHPQEMEIERTGLLRRDEMNAKALFADYQNFEQECNLILSVRQKIPHRVHDEQELELSYSASEQEAIEEFEKEYADSIIRITCPICPVFQPRRFNHFIGTREASLFSLYCLGCNSSFNACNSDLAPVVLTQKQAATLANRVINGGLTIKNAYESVIIRRTTGYARVSRDNYIKYELARRLFEEERLTIDQAKQLDYLTKRCPRCSYVTIINGGCRCIKCDNCRAFWCYTCCAQIFGPDGHDPEHCLQNYFGIQCANVHWVTEATKRDPIFYGYFDHGKPLPPPITDERYKFLAKVYEEKFNFCRIHIHKPNILSTEDKWDIMDSVEYDVKTGKCMLLKDTFIRNKAQETRITDAIRSTMAQMSDQELRVPANDCKEEDMIEWIPPTENENKQEGAVAQIVAVIADEQRGAVGNAINAEHAARAAEGNLNRIEVNHLQAADAPDAPPRIMPEPQQQEQQQQHRHQQQQQRLNPVELNFRLNPAQVFRQLPNDRSTTGLRVIPHIPPTAVTAIKAQKEELVLQQEQWWHHDNDGHPSHSEEFNRLRQRQEEQRHRRHEKGDHLAKVEKQELDDLKLYLQEIEEKRKKRALDELTVLRANRLWKQRQEPRSGLTRLPPRELMELNLMWEQRERNREKWKQWKALRNPSDRRRLWEEQWQQNLRELQELRDREKMIPQELPMMPPKYYQSELEALDHMWDQEEQWERGQLDKMDEMDKIELQERQKKEEQQERRKNFEQQARLSGPPAVARATGHSADSGLWRIGTDQHNRRYYLNTTTGQTQWNPPPFAQQEWFHNHFKNPQKVITARLASRRRVRPLNTSMPLMVPLRPLDEEIGRKRKPAAGEEMSRKRHEQHPPHQLPEWIVESEDWSYIEPEIQENWRGFAKYSSSEELRIKWEKWIDYANHNTPALWMMEESYNGETPFPPPHIKVSKKWINLDPIIKENWRKFASSKVSPEDVDRKWMAWVEYDKFLTSEEYPQQGEQALFPPPFIAQTEKWTKMTQWGKDRWANFAKENTPDALRKRWLAWMDYKNILRSKQYLDWKRDRQHRQRMMEQVHVQTTILPPWITATKEYEQMAPEIRENWESFANDKATTSEELSKKWQEYVRNQRSVALARLLQQEEQESVTRNDAVLAELTYQQEAQYEQALQLENDAALARELENEEAREAQEDLGNDAALARAAQYDEALRIDFDADIARALEAQDDDDIMENDAAFARELHQQELRRQGGGNSKSKSSISCPAKEFDVNAFNPRTKTDCKNGFIKTHPDKNPGCTAMAGQKFNDVRNMCNRIMTSSKSNHSYSTSVTVFKNIINILSRPQIATSIPYCDKRMQLHIYAQNYINIISETLVGNVNPEIASKWTVTFSTLIVKLVNEILLQTKYNTLIACINTMLNSALKNKKKQYIAIGPFNGVSVSSVAFYEYCITLLNQWRQSAHELPGLSVYHLSPSIGVGTPSHKQQISASASLGGRAGNNDITRRRQLHKKQVRVSRRSHYHRRYTKSNKLKNKNINIRRRHNMTRKRKVVAKNKK
jgi:hypothetical protein